MQKNGKFQHPVDRNKGRSPGALSSKARNIHPGVAKESATHGKGRKGGKAKAKY